jgi:hypothetical protein
MEVLAYGQNGTKKSGYMQQHLLISINSNTKNEPKIVHLPLRSTSVSGESQAQDQDPCLKVPTAWYKNMIEYIYNIPNIPNIQLSSHLSSTQCHLVTIDYSTV